ncbi:MAG: thioesterase family protein [Rhodospirillaceae bacterium]|nr:thioesterase family protein [Rhodospirillaceae bacterium]
MRDTLKPGAVHDFVFTVPREKTVPFLYPESPDFVAMPEVFATGFMVGLIEWACLDALRPHLEEGEGSLGTFIETTHAAPTLPGMTVRVAATCERVEGRQVWWRVEARDDLDLIGAGRHGRTVVRWDRFAERLEQKRRLFATRPASAAHLR